MSNLKKQIESLNKLFLDRENELLVWAEETDNPKLLDHVASILVRAASALQSVEEAVDKFLHVGCDHVKFEHRVQGAKVCDLYLAILPRVLSLDHV